MAAMATEQDLHMNGGDGETSYANNSLIQAPPKLNGKGRKRVVKKENNKVDGRRRSIINAALWYVEEFKEDLKVFLRSRSEELVGGGTMALTFVGRYDTPQLITHACLIFTLLNDMASRGKFIAKTIRAVLEPLMKAHFGEGINIDEVFLRFQNKVVQFMPILVYPTLLLSLAKNA
ncbi:Salicylate carboxymethyltransferase [Senna tora]|uniref:Salicylate carboxymethyltransferase n=1 Tax=Senna tora TaxID=362788 RepID=A0A834SW14_9FABA|nr:Salicylate carboxymethyltransferase [Senna tora]